MDGTILNSSLLNIEAFRYAVEPWGIKITYDDIERIRHHKSDTLFRDFLPNHQDHKIAFERLTKFAREQADKIQLFPGILEILKRIKKNGPFLGLWTGRDSESAVHLLKQKGLYQLFEAVVGSSCVQNNKPHPEGLLKIIQQSKVSPADTVVIGDHEHDIRAAKMSGCFAIYARWGELYEIPFGEYQPDLILNDTNDLAAMI